MPKISRDVWLDRFFKVHGNRYDYSKIPESFKGGDKVEIICKDHGSFLQRPEAHYRNKNGCPQCANLKNLEKSRFGVKRIIKLAKEVHGERYSYEKMTSSRMGSKGVVICPDHGEFYPHMFAHIRRGTGCPKCADACASEKNKRGLKEILLRCKDVHGDKYSYDKVYTNRANAYATITCPVHGDFVQQLKMHIHRKRGCPKCAYSKGRSLGEKEVESFIKKSYPGLEVKTSVRSIIPPYEIDIYLPKFSLAIEYNGNYWHSRECKGRLYHQKKYELALRNEVRLIQFWEYEWQEKKELCKALILAQLGQLPSVGARKTTVTKINGSEASKFYNDFHIQGSPAYQDLKYNYGLLFKDQLIAVMSFTFIEDGEFSLTRYATTTFQVQGGASKLLKAFLRDFSEVKTITTFCDHRIFSGDSYLKLGFTPVEKQPPRYVNYYNGCMYHRRWSQKKNLAKLFPEKFDWNLTEAENCKDLGIYQLYDAGKTKYIYTKELLCQQKD